MFPVASMVGHAYGQWKGEAVFKFQFIPESDTGRVQAQIELPPGANLAETQKVVEQVEKSFQEHKDVHYVLSNVATSVMTADPPTMRAYADLVEDTEIRERLLGRILDEHDRTPARTHVRREILFQKRQAAQRGIQ